MRREQAIGDARIPDHHEVEEGQNRYGLAPRHLDEMKDIEQKQFRTLVEGQGYGSAGKAPISRRHFPSRLSMAALQRRQRSSCPGTVPTSGRTIQQRAHLWPSARRKTAAAPRTSVSRKASAGGSSWRTAAPDVMAISARSTVSNNLASWASLTQ